MCALVAGQMHAIGLQDVRLEPVPVDAWRFRSASLAVGSDVFECSSFGGVEGTPPGWRRGRDRVRRRGLRGGELETIDVAGRIALFDWRGDQLFWPALTAAELGRAGAVGAVCTCLPGSRYYQADRALGSFDAIGLAGSPPLAYLRKEDAARVIDRLRRRRGARASDDRRRSRARGDRAQRGRGAAGPHRWLSNRHRRPSRLLVRGRLRRRDGRRRDARDREGARRRGLRAGAPDRLHVPHRRGVRPRRLGLRLADRRLVADRPRAPGVGRGGAALREHRRHGHGLPHGHRRAARAAALRQGRRGACSAGWPLAAWRRLGRPAHRHRAVAVRRRRRAEPRRRRRGLGLHADEVPHAVRRPLAGRSGVPRRGRQVLRAARDRGRPQPGRAARSRRPFTPSAAPRRAACARGLRR